MANIERVSIVATEEADCCAPSGSDVNEIEISTEDGGGGAYLIIKTERWAIDADKIDDFIKLLQKVWTMYEGDK